MTLTLSLKLHVVAKVITLLVMVHHSRALLQVHTGVAIARTWLRGHGHRPSGCCHHPYQSQYFYQCRLRPRLDQYQRPDDAEYRIPLNLEMERQLQLRGEPPIASLTWFELQEDETSQTAVQFLQERANQITLVNPWLQSGRIEQRGIMGLGIGTRNADLVFTTLLEAPPKIEIATATDAQLLVQNGIDCPVTGAEYQATLSYTTLDQRKGPLWRITVVPAYGSFGLVLSISHLVADIHAYYKLYDMLTSPTQEIVPLDLRVPNSAVEQQSDDIFSSSDELAQYHVGGPRVWNLIHSPWLVIKGALGILERKIWRPLAEGPFKTYNQYDETGNILSTIRMKRAEDGVEYWFEVQERELSQVKQLLILDKEQEEFTSTTPTPWNKFDELDDPTIPPTILPLSATLPQQGLSNKIRQPYYLSTNDVLSAWFFQMTNCRLGLICCNYRGKLKGHHVNLGRNYWGTYALVPNQYTSPFHIRQHILRPTVNDEQFPKLAAQLLCPEPIAVISSWTVPSTAIPYFPALEHWPLYDFASYCPANFVVLRTWWIERPQRNRKGRIGVYVAGDSKYLVEPIEFGGWIPSFLLEL